MTRGVLLAIAAVIALALAVDALEGPGPNASSLVPDVQDGPAASAEPLPHLTRAEALGQTIVGRFAGPAPSSDLLARIRRGELGGVILFSDNLTGSAASISRLTRTLQAAARAGGQPPLLIYVDQEGGEVKRLPGPPDESPRELGDPAEAFAAGRQTGEFLRGLGINFDLAPVADVPGRQSFIADRTFGDSPADVAAGACSFAAGLGEAGVGATLKHFPGLGEAAESTDQAPVRIDAPADVLRAAYAPYEACGSAPLTLVMVSSAIYPTLTGGSPAVMESATYEQELARVGAAEAPTISDDLEAPALEGFESPAASSLNAGLDLLLYAKTEAASASAFAILLKTRGGAGVRSQALRAAAERVMRLKAEIEPEAFERYLDRSG